MYIKPNRGVFKHRFINKCLACGSMLEGFYEKRFLFVYGYSIGYVCHLNKCKKPIKRRLLIKVLRNCDEQLKEILDDNFKIYPTEPIKELKGLTGSRKLNWLTGHKDLVLSYCRNNSISSACKIFYSKPSSLLGFIKRYSKVEIY